MSPRRRPTIAPARLASLRRRLLAWWAAGHRQLPWRFERRPAEPYRVWLAEVMLQQTRVEAVIPYYRRFVERWPTLDALAAAPDAEVFAAWSGLGYYARCRNLLAAARAALRAHGGLPASLPALRALPGFGPYTAGAVASIGFAIPAAALDGNAARVLSRLFALRGDPAAPRRRERLWALARALVGEPAPGGRAAPSRPPDPGDWNQALMELGATVCGRVPACGRCPLAAACAARAAGLAHAIPPPRPHRPRARLTLACAVILRGGEVLLVRRPARGLFAGLPAFPAAEVAAGADARDALERALRGSAIRARVGEELGAVDRILTHRELRLRAFRCEVAGPRAGGVDAWWVPADRLADAGLSSAMGALLPLIAPPPGAGRAGPRQKSTDVRDPGLAFSRRVV